MKQIKLNRCQATVLVFLKNTEKWKHYPAYIAAKKNFTLSYLSFQMRQLELNGLIDRVRRGTKLFYKLNEESPMIEAINVLTKIADDEIRFNSPIGKTEEPKNNELNKNDNQRHREQELESSQR